jgi:hypothetical protein
VEVEETVEHLEEDNKAGEDTTMEDSTNQETIRLITISRSSTAGIATFQGIAKRIVARDKETTNHVLVSMDPPTGQNQSKL